MDGKHGESFPCHPVVRDAINAGKMDRIMRLGNNEMFRVDMKGRLHGVCKSWHSNGQHMEDSTYVKGQLHGVYKSWHSNGQQMAESTYVEGRLHGPCKRWWDNGQLWEDVTYVKGERVQNEN